MTMVVPTQLEKENIRTWGFDAMLNRFNKEVHASGVLKEVKKRQAYEKPSDKRSREKRETAAKIRRKEKKDALHR